MSPKEKIILEELRKNARTNLTYLAFKAGMPLSSAHNLLRKLENSVIKKHTSLIDFRKMGYHAWTSIIIKVSKTDRDALKDYLLKYKDVNSVFEIDSNYDFLIDVIHENQTGLKQFIERMKDRFEIKTIQKLSIINDLQREKFLTK